MLSKIFLGVFGYLFCFFTKPRRVVNFASAGIENKKLKVGLFFYAESKKQRVAGIEPA